MFESWSPRYHVSKNLSVEFFVSSTHLSSLSCASSTEPLYGKLQFCKSEWAGKVWTKHFYTSQASFVLEAEEAHTQSQASQEQSTECYKRLVLGFILLELYLP